jgi:RNA recognition motif-containing protein
MVLICALGDYLNQRNGLVIMAKIDDASRATNELNGYVLRTFELSVVPTTCSKVNYGENHFLQSALNQQFPLNSPYPDTTIDNIEHVRQNLPAPPASPGEQPIILDPCNLYVKHLDPDLFKNTANLLSLFEPYGKILSAQLVVNPDGVSRGFGFVSFSAPCEALLAKGSLNGKVAGSACLYVAYAERKQDRVKRFNRLFKNTKVTPIV